MSDDLASNSLGRVYCLWLIAKRLGYDTRIVGNSTGPVWGPLRGTEFEAEIVRCRSDLAVPWGEDFEPDLLIPVKAFPSSFGQARVWSGRFGIPILLDVDDPDPEVALAFGRPIRRVAKWLLKPRLMARQSKLRKIADATPTIVSNPALREAYGGAVIPHVREDLGCGSNHERTDPTVAFVGTARKHKGISLLRKAVRAASPLGYRLVVTDSAPSKTEPWEEWVGSTDFKEGLRLVAGSDVVVIPSLQATMSRGQLPAKLIDAMMLGRAVVVSDLPPMRWALGDAGLSFEAGSVAELVDALAQLKDPSKRAELGAAARERALKMFTPEAAMEDFRRACEGAIAGVGGSAGSAIGA